MQSGSLAIISKRVGLDRVGGGDIGLSRPAVRAELNFVKEVGKESPPLTAADVCCVDSMTSIFRFDDVSEGRRGGGSGGDGGGGGGGGNLLDAGQHQEWWGETTVVEPSLRSGGA